MYQKPLKFHCDIDKERVKTAEWLLGAANEKPGGWRMSNWSKSRRRLASPFTHYLKEVYRFSLDRGLTLDYANDPEESLQQQLVDTLIEKNHLKDLLYAAMERGAITGQTYWFYWIDTERYYRIYLFDACEVVPYPEEHEHNGYMVQVKGKGDWWERYGFTDSAYIEYQKTKNPDSVWVESAAAGHNYGKVPVVKTPHIIKDHSGQGCEAFDWHAIEMAIEICSQTLSAASNYTYFGGPFLVSGDKKETLKELLGRSQVLSGSTDPAIQNTEALKLDAMPAEHSIFVEDLGKSLCGHLGVSWVPDDPPSDTSSITLRMLNSKTIITAEKLGDRYVGALKELLQDVLLAAAVDSVIVGVNSDPETYQLEHRYEHPVFPATPAEKQMTLTVVEQLQTLGISPEIALMEYYPGKTSDEIQEMMLGA